MSNPASEVLRGLPSVSEVMEGARGKELAERFGRGALRLELRGLLEETREAARAGKVKSAPTAEAICAELERRLARLVEPMGRRAINASGILLHTGLGRAPLCREAIEAMGVASHYSILQASLSSGDRSLREERIQRLLCELTGCEAATIVNNNAAATMLVLNTLAGGKEAIISRGQLVEIGGSFRMTDVMGQSGATLREVGTTNRTHLRDYEGAIGERTGAIVHAHTSNYRIRGFTGWPGIGELAELAHRHNLPVVDDVGSGALVQLSEFGLSDEPLVRDSVGAGADVACFSGDKLICGPQCGLILGKKAIVEKMRKNPYARMFRVCKLTLAAMEATLLHFINGTWRSGIPFYRMMSRAVEELERDARALVEGVKGVEGLSAEVGEDIAYVGSGSIPDEGIPSRVVRLTHARISAGELARRLRTGMPSVFARMADRNVVLDMRTLHEGEAQLLIDAVRAAVKAGASWLS